MSLSQQLHGLGLMLCSRYYKPLQHTWAFRIWTGPSTEAHDVTPLAYPTSWQSIVTMSDCAGTRQSRRLAALAEAQPHSPPEAHTLKQKTNAGSAQGTETHMHGQGTEPAASDQAQSMTGSAALLQASTLEASANVLKGLVSLCPVTASCIQAFYP